MKRSSSLRLTEWPSAADLLGVAPSLASPPRASASRPPQLHRLDDVLVAGAAADVAGERPADLLLGRVRVLGEQRDASASSPACRSRTGARAPPGSPPGSGGASAPAASPSTVVSSRPSAWTANTVQDFTGTPSSEHRAGAAARRVAADVRAGQAERLAQEVDEQQPRLDVRRARLAVHRDGERTHDVPLLAASVVLGHLRLLLSGGTAASAAVRSPRSVKTRTTLRLYSALPRTSSRGSRGLGREARRPRRSPRRRAPRRASASSAARARRLRGPTPVSAMPGRARPSRSSNETCTATPTVAKSPTLRSSFRYVPPARGPGSGTRTSVTISFGSSAVVNGPWKKLVDRDRPRPARAPCACTSAPAREHRRAPVALRVGVGERAADGAEVAHDRIGDLRRGVAEHAVAAPQQLRALAGPCAGRARRSRGRRPPRASPSSPAIRLMSTSASRRREAKLHQRDQALAAGRAPSPRPP